MPIDFQLSTSEAGTRAAAAAFAEKVLRPSRSLYAKLPTQRERFQATRPVYEAAAASGLVKGQIRPELGGSGGSLVEAAILVEECYTVEPSASLTVFATGLGLSPLNIVQKPELKEFLAPFLSGAGAPLASLVFSEPGGVANWLERGGRGLNTTARKDGNEWVLNGEKLWATNSAGWDYKGPDLACVVCRDVTSPPSDDQEPRDSIMILLVTRADLERNGPDAFQVVGDVETMGHTSVSGPHIKYTNVRLPLKNVLCAPGDGAAVVNGAFDSSAVLVGAMSVGLMRAAFDASLAFARSDDRRGAVPLLERQAVADLLSGIKMQTEACRALVWKAAYVLENGPGDYDARRELALAAKVYCSDAAVKAVTEAINAVGITAYDNSLPFAGLLTNAMVLPIFDGGNVGIRRRHLQQLMLAPSYDAWATTFGPSKQ
ncbi:acyl-CoA dehydrogenase domain-containing protein [Durotheca rogersii]|uniref:acyl-CoA dehydrogenase domain-containing protein n=1 Tax=Durotheca rogersii TaxID=419775 RepID=UPI002220A048|nr:acyl-CoA dehydrogenase domain-containing protein [Durotheca rogersii]KAI5865918.1 acyl-CoA dehydrogenase domain-containing protein [Durotheca rogersii]